MPAIEAPISTQVTQPVQRRGFSLDDTLRLPLNDVRNSGSSPLQCQMPNTPGEHERAASGLAISETYGVMRGRRNAAENDGNRREVKALDRAIAWVGPGSAPKPKIQAYLTAFGGMRGGLALMQREEPDNERVNRCLVRMDETIGDVCVRIGRCDSPPDGYAYGGATNKLSDEIAEAARVMLQCADEVGRENVMWGIAKAMLPQSMMKSIAERTPDALSKVIRGDALPKDLIEVRIYRALQNVLSGAMNSGEPVAFANAILHLLKVPEYVETDVPGRNGDQPKVPEQARTPFNPGPGPSPHQNTGAPWAYNNAPVTVKNDFTEFMRNQQQPPLKLTDLRNLLNDSFQQGYALSQAHALNTQLQREIADLKEKLQTSDARLNVFAKGPDLVRVPGGSSDDNANSTERQERDIAPPNDDRDPLVRLDPSSPRDPRVPDLNRQQNQLNQQNRQDRQTNEHSEQRQVNSRGNGNGGPRNNNLPPEDEVDNTSRPINRASTSRQPDDEALNRLNQNNRNNRNNRNNQDNQDNQDNQNQRQRLGNTEQRLERQRTEQNRQQQRGSDDNRLDNRRAPSGTGNFHYEEFKYFLGSLGIPVGRLDPDPFQPASVRGLEEGKPWNPERGVNPVRWIHPSGVKEYVEKRSAKAGKPFVTTAKQRPLAPPEKTLLQTETEAFFRRNQQKAAERAQRNPATTAVPPTRIGGVARPTVPAAAPQTPASSGNATRFRADVTQQKPSTPIAWDIPQHIVIEELVPADSKAPESSANSTTGMADRSVAWPQFVGWHSFAPEVPTSVRSTLDPLPSSPFAARGELNRSDSRASIASNESDASETGAELGKRIYSASRQSRPTLPPRAGHGPLNAPAAGLTPLALLARSIPSAPIVETAVRTHAASPASPGSANGQRQDVLRRRAIVDDSRIPRGEKERSVSFSVPRDPQESIDPYAVYEFRRDGEPLHSEVTPGQQYASFNEEWDALSSSSTSSASSVAGDGPEELVDFGDFEPEDNMVVQRSYSAVSMDSGRDSPPVLSADESGESKTPLRVADRAALNPKGNDLADPTVQLIKELSERLKGMKGAEE